MPYTRNTLHCLQSRTGPVGINIWLYDTTDATGVVDGTDYMTGVGAGAANPIGMEGGDLVYVRIWTTAVPTTTALKNATAVADAGLHIVRTISAAGAATLSAETAIVVAAGT